MKTKFTIGLEKLNNLIDETVPGSKEYQRLVKSKHIYIQQF
jgi:hypothetical protein